LPVGDQTVAESGVIVEYLVDRYGQGTALRPAAETSERRSYTYWLHSAEHGSVIFLINCHRDPDCAADFGRFQAIADAFPSDPACSAQDKHRIVISGDTLITTRFAAVAWNWSLGSDCFDSAAFAGFLKDHYAHAPENICGGGTNFPGTGWCNGPLALAAPRMAAHKASRTWRAALWPGLPENVRPDGKSLAPREQ